MEILDKNAGKGRIAIYDSSWYRKVLIDRFEKKAGEKEVLSAYDSIQSFERQLTDDGMVLIKIFLCISQEEQKKRFDKLLARKETAWRVSKKDLKRNREFKKYKRMNEEMLQKTDTDYAPWTTVEATDRRFATIKIYTTVINCLSAEIEKRKQEKQEEIMPNKVLVNNEISETVWAKANLDCSYTKAEYKKRLKKLQKEIEKLHGELYRKGIPVVLGFEGWDAAGKGGAIKRLTEKWIREDMWCIRQRHRMIWSGHIIIFGDFGEQCQKQGILLFLTERGTEGYWWNGLKDFAVKKSGRERIRKSMTWNGIW